MKPNRFHGLFSLVCLFILCAASAQADPREAKLYVITNWPSTGNCSGNDVSAWDDMALGWYDEATKLPVFFKDGVWTNGTFNRKILCDPDSGQSPCTDYKRVDDADAAMIALHGTDVGKHWAGLLRVATNGDDCLIHAPEGASTDAVFVGDADLEFLHLSSCNSMDDDNLKQTWRLFEDPVDSNTSGNRLHVATGFHGVMAISTGLTENYKLFASTAHLISIADSWLDFHYVPDITYNTGAVGDQCPVAYAIAATGEGALFRIGTESYGNIFNSGPFHLQYYAYSYIEGCNPVGEKPFDDPND